MTDMAILFSSACACGAQQVTSWLRCRPSFVQGVVRPGLLSLRERYRLRGRELAEDGLVLAEQLDAAREGNAERLEELAALRRQVGVLCLICLHVPCLLSGWLAGFDTGA
jgi:hypothetical protein